MTTWGFCAVLLVAAFAAVAQPDAHQRAVLALDPVGFWPVDDSAGRQLRDLAAGGNHAKVFNTPWRDSVLDFSGAFEFIEIPANSAYMSPAFSLGTWVFVRKPRRGSATEERSTYLLGNWSRDWKLRPGPISLRLTGKEKRTIEVVSNKAKDMLGTVAAGIRIHAESWQHLLYTYRGGTGTLYLNGEAVASKSGIDYTPQKDAYIAGADSRWWFLYPPRGEALDGSLRDIVLFNRALDAKEAERLAQIGSPAVMPHVRAVDEVRFNGRFIRLADLATLDPQEQRLVIRLMHLSRFGWHGDLQANAAVLIPYLAKALRQPLIRYDAALVLEKMKDKTTLAAAKPHLLATIADTTAESANRATAALTLGRLGSAALDVLPELIRQLRAEAAAKGTGVPRVEDAFRNALINAIFSINATGLEARRVLGDVYAKPMLAYLRQRQPYTPRINTLVRFGRWLDALDLYKPIIREQKLYFRSQNNPHRDQRSPNSGNARAYTAMDDYKGYTYKLGNGEAFGGGVPVSQEAYETALKLHGKNHSEAKKWLGGEVELMFRADLKKIAPDGSIQTVFMGGPNFIFSGQDAKVMAWSVAVDKEGYIHVMGGQHNYPRYSDFMPGAWESIGLSPDSSASNYPTTLYWVSKRPEDITEFEFVGLQGNPRDIPAPYMNYINFVQDRNEELYLYGRNDKGIQSWAWYRYNVDTRRWQDLGGARGDIFASAQRANPDWVEGIRQVKILGYRGYLPSGRADEYPTLSWAWQPNFYNYIRSTRGVQFDPSNRMYIEIPTYGYESNGRVCEANLFAYSDDGGRNFRRADGTPVRLPFTSNPAPEHNADILQGYNEIWLNQWKQLIHRVGFIF